MPGVCRAFLDTAGGLILVGDSRVIVDGQPVAVEGNPVENHGRNEHSNATMINGNSRVVVGGIPVCTESSQASCGDTPTGSSRVVIG
jgi:uncharacterized Zn-binding protein involved in type VI secretion